jgi:hypothetical protein
MDSPQKFKKIGKAFVGYAVGMKSPTGSEIIILCPTKDEAIVAAESWGKVNPEEVKRAALGPVSLLGAAAKEGKQP